MGLEKIDNLIKDSEPKKGQGTGERGQGTRDKGRGTRNNVLISSLVPCH